MTPLMSCCGTGMQRTGETQRVDRTITTLECHTCGKVAEVVTIPTLGWTITEYETQRAKHAAELAAVVRARALVDAPEPWDTPTAIEPSEA